MSNLITNAAVVFVSARASLAIAKRERLLCKCEIAESDESPCYYNEPVDQDEICEDCKKRLVIDARVKILSKESTAAWYKLKRTVIKENP